MDGVNYLKATEKLQWESLLFTIQFPGVPGTWLFDLGRIKGWVDFRATQWFWNQYPGIVNPVP